MRKALNSKLVRLALKIDNWQMCSKLFWIKVSTKYQFKCNVTTWQLGNRGLTPEPVMASPASAEYQTTSTFIWTRERNEASRASTAGRVIHHPAICQKSLSALKNKKTQLCVWHVCEVLYIAILYVRGSKRDFSRWPNYVKILSNYGMSSMVTQQPKHLSVNTHTCNYGKSENKFE